MKQMMVDLFDKQGWYNYKSFTGNNDTWTIVGSESVDDSDWGMMAYPWYERSVGNTIDTFKSSAGIFKDIRRRIVYNNYIKGVITPVESSLIPKLSSGRKR